jgi:ADP-heptose:LPS heptosyltransferase
LYRSFSNLQPLAPPARPAVSRHGRLQASDTAAGNFCGTRPITSKRNRRTTELFFMNILVIAASGIGDTLIATPFIHELRANFPEAKLHALVLWKGSKDLLEGNPHLEAIHQKNLIHDSKLSSVLFLFGLRRRRFDISINAHTQGRIHYRIVARLIGAPLRLSHEYENHGWLDRRLVNRTLPQDYSIHSVENNNRLLKLLDKQPLLPRHELEIFLPSPEQEWASSFFSENRLTTRKRLGIHIGSGGTKNLRLKRWPFANYLELIQRLNKTSPDLAILLFGGPEEQDEHQLILTATRGFPVYAPPTKNLCQAAALMRHCHGFLSVDTALMHLAAAMKIPNQLVIEAPTLNPTNVPWGTSYQLIPNPIVHGRNLEYYRYDGGPIRGSDDELRRIMAAVTVDDVFRAVVKALG